MPDLNPSKVGRAVRPFQEFFRQEAASGVLLMAATALALAWANIGPQAYAAFWHQSFGVADYALLNHTLGHWVNDGLMTLFFFVVGLEIKREVRGGELSDWNRASLPVFAALGGMLLPAGLFLAFNHSGADARGWGIPMATDIAFALGVLSLLGRRVPGSARVFLAAVAIADDLGAVLVIALFYSHGLSLGWLAASAAVYGLLAGLNRLSVRALSVYVLGTVVLWFCVSQSGVHPTIAGVLAATAVPVTLDGNESPLHKLEHLLHPWVAFGVMPLFALANAGIPLGSMSFGSPVLVGIVVGLVAGKAVGIFLFSWVAVKAGFGALPPGLGWRHVVAISILGGIGFTMAIFIAGLAFGPGEAFDSARNGILLASVTAALVGSGFIFFGLKPVPDIEASSEHEVGVEEVTGPR